MSKNPSNRKLNAALRDGQTNTPKSGRTALGSLTLAALWTMAAQASQLPRQDRQQAEAEGESPEQLQHSAQEAAQAALTSAEGPGPAGKEAASTGGEHAMASTPSKARWRPWWKAFKQSRLNDPLSTTQRKPHSRPPLRLRSFKERVTPAPPWAHLTPRTRHPRNPGEAPQARQRLRWIPLPAR